MAKTPLNGNNKYSDTFPCPEWMNRMRQLNWAKTVDKYKEGYDKIVWNKNKGEQKCTNQKEQEMPE